MSGSPRPDPGAASIKGRRPLFFGPAGSRLFGLFDPPPKGSRAPTAALICPPAGQEYVRAHRSLVQLGLRLSRRGIPVLRFDYSGSGDSAGDLEDGSISQWVDDVGHALDEARRLSGCDRVRIVGLRLGATLALLAATDRNDVDALALWAPVVDGAGHLEELQRLHQAFLRFAYVDAPPHLAGEEPDEILGFPLTPTLQSELEELDLRSIEGRVPSDVLLVQAGPDPGVREFALALEERGARVTKGPDPNHEVWRAETYRGLVATTAIGAIEEWLSRLGP